MARALLKAASSASFGRRLGQQRQAPPADDVGIDFGFASSDDDSDEDLALDFEDEDTLDDGEVASDA